MADNDRTEFAYGTTGVVRLMRIGFVFHAEQMRGPNDWKVFARISGPDAYSEACHTLNSANIEMAQKVHARRVAREGG